MIALLQQSIDPFEPLKGSDPVFVWLAIAVLVLWSAIVGVAVHVFTRRRK